MYICAPCVHVIHKVRVRATLQRTRVVIDGCGIEPRRPLQDQQGLLTTEKSLLDLLLSLNK